MNLSRSTATGSWTSCAFAIIFFCLLLKRSQAFGTGVSDLDSIDLGASRGLSPSMESITNENLQKIIVGVENGNKESIYYFGLLKLYGISVPKNESSAASSFQSAAALGHPEASTAYGVLLMLGMGVSKDIRGAAGAFREGIARDDKNAYWLMGKLLSEGGQEGVASTSSIPTNYQEAASLFAVAAAEHIPQAEHYLAMLYEYGLGVEQNFQLAREYYRRAAEQKFLESMYHLALMYSYGRGGPQDYRRAFSLLDGAARENHAPSCYYMGLYKMYGYACEPNYDHAVNWFERAAGLNDFRISAKAEKAASELRDLVSKAEAQNEQFLDQLVRRSEIQ